MFRVKVEGGERLSALSRNARSVLDATMRASIPELESLARDIITTVFIEACSTAGEGFPTIYQTHVLETLDNIPIDVSADANGIFLNFSLDALGSYADFEEGFHYHAEIAGESSDPEDKELVDLPYQGEPLKNEIGKRYALWLKILHAGGTMLDNTYAARVAYWESTGKAPEWLLLQYGESRYEPTVSAFPLYERIQTEINVAFAATFERLIDEADGTAYQEYFEPTQPIYRYNVRDSRGRFTKK